MENFRHAFDMPSYIYYTQAMQAECLAAAYRSVPGSFCIPVLTYVTDYGVENGEGRARNIPLERWSGK